MSLDLDYDPDDQDQAEAFDSDNLLSDDSDEMPTSDMQRDLLDVTSAVGDANDFQAEDADDFDPDAVDEEEFEMLVEEDDGIDSSRTLPRDDADLVMSDADDTPAGSEGPMDDVVDDYADDDEADGEESEAEARGDPTQPTERALDEGVEETFPASDPVSVSPGAD